MRRIFSRIQHSRTTRSNDVLREFYTAMQQYNNLTGGKVTVEYLDLNLNPTLRDQYAEYEVSEGSFLFTCGDRHRTITLNDLFTQEANDYYGYSYSYTSKVELAARDQPEICDRGQAAGRDCAHRA